MPIPAWNGTRPSRFDVRRKKADLAGFAFAAGMIGYLVLAIVPIVASGLSPSELWELKLSGEMPGNAYALPGIAWLFACCLVAIYHAIDDLRRDHLGTIVALSLLAALNLMFGSINTQAFVLVRFANLIVTIETFCGLISFWYGSQRSRQLAFSLSAYLLYAILIVGYLWHGNGNERWGGRLQPNHFGRYAVVAFFFLTLAKRRIVPTTLVASLVLTLIVSSRTSLVGLLVFLLLVYTFTPQEERPSARLYGLLFVTLAVISADAMFGRGTMIDMIADKLSLASDSRGVGSGLSGRTETYGTLLDQDVVGLTFGYGFQAIKYLELPLHSGILKGVFEFGVPLASAVYLAIGRQIWRCLRVARLPEAARLRVCAAFAVASLAMTFSEPDSFAIGFPGSLAFMLALASPLLVLEGDIAEPPEGQA